MDLLNEGFANLANSPSDFDFALSSGFAGFDSPATFSQFNRAVAARVALYQGNNQQVLTFLNGSFFDINGDLYSGPFHVFGATGNDILNAQFHVPNQLGQEFMVHDSWIADAAAGNG